MDPYASQKGPHNDSVAQKLVATRAEIETMKARVQYLEAELNGRHQHAGEYGMSEARVSACPIRRLV